MRNWYACTALLLALTCKHNSVLAQAPEPTGVSITFVANEGVMISDGQKKVLIDALYRRYKDYALAPDSVRSAIEGARAPFDRVNLILATHHHGDHFHPAAVAAHMRANPGAHLLTSEQVIDSLRRRIPTGDPLYRRIRSATTPVGRIRNEVIDGVTVRLLGLEHHGLEHLGYVVELGGRRILHVGDTNGEEADFAPLRLDTARIDVALLPAWMITNPKGRAAIDRWIKPRHIIAIHVDAATGERTERAVSAARPGATTFFRPLEVRRF